MTTINVQYTTRDLLRLGFYAARRSPTLKWTMSALALTVLGINLVQQRSHLGGISLFAIFLTTVFFTGAAYVLILLTSPILTVLQNLKRSRTAETHGYRLADTGLVCTSRSAEALLKWNGAWSLHKSRNAIYVGVSRSCYFSLPRHSFASEEQYQSFWDGMQGLVPGTAESAPSAQ